MDNRPIGVFDSGLGGLTAVKELRTILPNEQIVYFGDTGRVPYGTRSVKTIEKYAAQDIRFLSSMDIKLVIAACGTVSSVAPHVGMAIQLPFIGVVDPASKAAAAATKTGRVGVIGTTATIKSKAFDKALHTLNPDIQVFTRECPLFVPLVESGWFRRDDEIAKLTAQRYLVPLREKKIDTLILGCTHFPLLWDVIHEVMGPEVTLINTGCEAAHTAAALLREKDALCERPAPGACRFFVSDSIDGFQRLAGILLGSEESLDVRQVDIDSTAC